MHSSGGFSLTRRPQRCCSTSTSCQALSFVFSSTMAPMAAPPSASSTPQIDEHNGKNSGDCAPDDPSQSRYTRNPGSPLKRLVSIIGASLGTPPSPLASAAHSGHDRRRRPPPRRLIGQDLPAAESPASSSLDLRQPSNASPSSPPRCPAPPIVATDVPPSFQSSDRPPIKPG
jgi:hypothetical protein